MAFTAKSDANLRFFFGLAKTLREFFYNYELGIAFGEPATVWMVEHAQRWRSSWKRIGMAR